MQFEVLLDHGETPNKCTIAPLSYRKDFSIRRFPKGSPIAPLTTSFLLHHDGQPIEALPPSERVGNSLAAIDCIWSRLPTILKWLEGPVPRLVRIPDGFVTAYPRHSKISRDPDGGLATIEALFIGAALLGHWDPTLLSQYFFGDKFLELNRSRFTALGVTCAANAISSVFDRRQPRDAIGRRVGRGRMGAI